MALSDLVSGFFEVDVNEILRQKALEEAGATDTSTTAASDDDNFFGGATAPDEPDEPAAPDFSSDSPLQFQILKEWVQDLDVPATLSTRFVEEWGNDFFKENGRWPYPAELSQNGDFMNGLQSLTSLTSIALPKEFKVRFPDGSVRVMENSLQNGLQEIPQWNDIPSWRLDSDMTAFLDNLPTFTLGQVQEQLAMFQNMGKRKTGGGGGGRSGPAPRADRPFDRAQMKRTMTDIWRRYLLEEPDNVDALVDEYIGAANNFWKSKGGNLDFETYAMNKIEESDRGRILYWKRPEGMSMDQYLAQYQNVVAGAGLSNQSGVEATMRGLSGGASAQGRKDRHPRPAVHRQPRHVLTELRQPDSTDGT